MATTKQGKRSGKKRGAKPTSCSVLSHPIRARILEVVNEHPMSPVQFINLGLAGRHFESKQQALSQVSYHFRELEKAGCIEVIEVNQRRGATEHIYRGTCRVYFTDEEFAALPEEKRSQLSKSAAQGLFARVDGAIASGTFDKRPDRHLTWRAMRLDEQGMQEMLESMRGSFEEQNRIREEAERRLSMQFNEGAVPFTVGMVGFESPPHPLSLDDPDMEKELAGLGAAAQKLREGSGLTQEQVAKRAGLSARFICELEAGQVDPSIPDLWALAAGLGVTSTTLVNKAQEQVADRGD